MIPAVVQASEALQGELQAASGDANLMGCLDGYLQAVAMCTVEHYSAKLMAQVCHGMVPCHHGKADGPGAVMAWCHAATVQSSWPGCMAVWG